MPGKGPGCHTVGYPDCTPFAQSTTRLPQSVFASRGSALAEGVQGLPRPVDEGVTGSQLSVLGKGPFLPTAAAGTL